MSKEKPNYDNKDARPICNGWNDLKVTSIVDGRINECETHCKKCGHVDYWAYGWYEPKGV